METTTAITWSPIPHTDAQEADLEGIFRAQVCPQLRSWTWTILTSAGDTVTGGVAGFEASAKAAVAAWVDSPKSALESIRVSLRNECISMGELAMLQNELVEYIEPGDVELLEAAGVPEFPDEPEMTKEAALTIVIAAARDEVESLRIAAGDFPDDGFDYMAVARKVEDAIAIVESGQ